MLLKGNFQKRTDYCVFAGLLISASEAELTALGVAGWLFSF
jgi:hypothetical protein